ncbi:hypothetical protein HELRODRAFT_186235 [Helobdella robusta]|uniref:Deoxyhypusine hydroxylase n=1 Tax=Helobdella robusta TaxID=6412 RepID=T1FNU8_HELRO|nr:hypothetical protein HELRODRAFT_186235 [Helobdella robusta]ESN89892.1 hypothetical protein HELRODRAFT_186235 [Helobdella robusta]
MAPDITINQLTNICKTLEDRLKPLPERFRALFTLRNLGGKAAIDSISRCFSDPSVLLKHELAYCLGQMQDKYAIPTLINVLEDGSQEVIVRHEAGEALGAIGSSEVLNVLEKHRESPIREISETCQLAIARLNWLKNRTPENPQTQEESTETTTNPSNVVYMSVDPAPPAVIRDVQQLKCLLLDEKQSLFDRYRAMFALRNQGGPEAVKALAQALNCDGALFRHEIAYVLGQMQDADATEGLLNRLQDQNESAMVRHECAEALGSIATDKCENVLKNYLNDEEEVVSQSCEVALDMANYERSASQFEYADGLTKQRLERQVAEKYV